MPNGNPTTGAGSTVQNGSLSIEDQALLGSDVNVTNEDIETTDPLTGTGSTVQTTETDLNLGTPTDNIISSEEYVTTGGVTAEQQAEFDRQQAEGDRIMREKEEARIKAEQEAEAKRLEEQAKKQAEITTVTAEQQAEFDRQQAEADRLVSEGKALPPEQIQDITTFKQAGGTLDNLASLVSNKYGGLPEVQGDKVVGEIDGVPYEWVIDESGNPIRSKIEEKVTIGKDEFIETLSGMFVGGSSDEDIKKYITDNREIYNANKGAIISHLKNEGFNKETLEKSQAIAKMNGDEIDKAIKNGKINVGDLSPEAKQRYDAYLNVNRKNDISNAEDVSELVYDNTLKDYETITNNYKLNAKGLLDDINALYNTGDIKDSNDALNTKYKELTKKKRELKNMPDKIREDNKGIPSGLVNSKIAKEERRLKGEIEDLIDEYNVELSNYQRLESLADKEASILGAELDIETASYTNRLNQYNQNKGFMREDEKMAFEEANKVFAENRALANQKNLLEFQNKIAQENRKGTWENREDGLYYLEDINGKPKATKVLDGTGSFTKNDDGTFTYLTVQNGQPYTETLDINGNKVFTNGTTNFGDDFRKFAYRYPNEASVKNNNPAGITWNQTFSDTLSAHGISHSKGTARPANEGGNYFNFPDIQNGMKAFALLWDLPSYNKLTVKQALNRWGTGSVTIDVDPNTKISDLGESDLRKLQIAQLKKESPGFYTELTNAGYIRDGNFAIPEVVEETVLTDSDIATFNSTTFKPEKLTTASEKAKYKAFLDKRKEIFSKEDPTMEEILSISSGGKQLTDTPITQLTKFGTVLSGAGDLLATIEEANKSTFGPGPITGKIAELNPWNTPAQTLKRQLISLIPNLARGVYGEVGVLTDNDVKLYSQTLPNLTQTEDVNKAILALTMKTIQRSYQNTLKTQASAGRDVSGFIGQYNELVNTVKGIEDELGINSEAIKVDHNDFLNRNGYTATNNLTPEQMSALDSIY